jgi:hypothetical protein
VTRREATVLSVLRGEQGLFDWRAAGDYTMFIASRRCWDGSRCQFGTKPRKVWINDRYRNCIEILRSISFALIQFIE